MFAPRYFAPRYFAPRYFPPGLPTGGLVWTAALGAGLVVAGRPVDHLSALREQRSGARMVAAMIGASVATSRTDVTRRASGAQVAAREVGAQMDDRGPVGSRDGQEYRADVEDAGPEAT